MWDDVIIGTGDKGNSAVLLRKVTNNPLSISHNIMSYWISNAYMDCGMTIFKNTTEGMTLTAALQVPCTDEELIALIDGFVLDHIDPAVLKEKIRVLVFDAWKRGREHQAQLMHTALTYSHRSPRGCSSGQILQDARLRAAM